MNRMEEYTALLRELDETPARLNDAVTRGKSRLHRQKLRRLVGMPLTSAAAACLCFVLLVNLSLPFAMACARIPVIRGLAAAVSFDPSLRAAVNNKWVQSIGLTDQDGESAMTIEYVIVDEKQLNIFYTLEVNTENDYATFATITGMAGEEITGYLVLNSYSVQADGGLSKLTVDFTGAESMPDALLLAVTLCVQPDRPQDGYTPVGNFRFELSFDPGFTAQGETVEINRWMELDGQRILLKSVEIYPTHMRLNLEDDPDNTAWLRGLEFYAEDEKGNRYDSIKNGIVSTGSPDTPFTRSFRLDSSYFTESTHLTLHITQAAWLEKDKQWMKLDLTTMETESLPEKTVFHWLRWEEDDLTVSFRVYDEAAGRRGHDMFLSWRAPDGTVGYIKERGMSEASDEPGCWDMYSKVEDYAWDTIELELNRSMTTQYSEPVAIDLF